MFQAVPPPIISSSKLYIQHWVLVKLLLLPAASGTKSHTHAFPQIEAPSFTPTQNKKLSFLTVQTFEQEITQYTYLLTYLLN
jgi:hypothetical protein